MVMPEPTERTEHKAELRTVPLSALIVDSRVQRPLDTRRADKMAAELNLDALGLVCASHRDDGTYAIIDGQHRVAALRIAGFVEEPVECEVFSGLTLADEAVMFRLRNNTAKPQYIDRFRVRVIEGDPTAKAIVRTLRRHGWQIALSTSPAHFAAIQAFERIHDREPVAAEKAIATITRAWGHESNGANGCIVEGIGLIYLRYGDAVSVDDLIDRLSKFPAGAGALLGKARGLRDLIGSTIPKAVAEIVVELYNARRKTKALPPWRAS
jgi:hypothetical protein